MPRRDPEDSRIPFRKVVERAAEIAENPFARAVGGVLRWSFRLLVAGSITVALYAGRKWMDERTDERIAAHPIVLESKKSVETMAPLLASQAQTLSTLANSSAQSTDAFMRIDRSLRSLESTVSVISAKLDDVKEQAKADVSRLDSRLDTISRSGR